MIIKVYAGIMHLDKLKIYTLVYTIELIILPFYTRNNIIDKLRQRMTYLKKLIALLLMESTLVKGVIYVIIESATVISTTRPSAPSDSRQWSVLGTPLLEFNTPFLYPERMLTLSVEVFEF